MVLAPDRTAVDSLSLFMYVAYTQLNAMISYPYRTQVRILLPRVFEPFFSSRH